MKHLFTKLLQQHPDFPTICQGISQGRFPLNIVGLSAVHKANMVAALCDKYQKTAVVLTPDEPTGRRLCDDLKTMCGEDSAAFFPMREFCFRDVDSTSHEYEHERLNLLGRAVQGRLRFAVASIEGALQYTIPPKTLEETALVLERGKEIPVEEITSMLVRAGYVRREQVDGVSQFAVRGGILDLYPPHLPRPVRVEFWGEEIDSLNFFDLDTQRREEEIQQLHITPAKEVLFESTEQFRQLLEQLPQKLRGKQRENALAIAHKDLEKLDSGLEIASLDKYLPLLYPAPATLFDYFPDAFVFVSEFTGIKDSAKKLSGSRSTRIWNSCLRKAFSARAWIDIPWTRWTILAFLERGRPSFWIPLPAPPESLPQKIWSAWTPCSFPAGAETRKCCWRNCAAIWTAASAP